MSSVRNLHFRVVTPRRAPVMPSDGRVKPERMGRTATCGEGLSHGMTAVMPAPLKAGYSRGVSYAHNLEPSPVDLIDGLPVILHLSVVPYAGELLLLIAGRPEVVEPIVFQA
jgi:hypothetical protein